MVGKRGRGRPKKPPAEKYTDLHITLPPDVAGILARHRRPNEADSTLIARMIRSATMLIVSEGAGAGG